jgi:uncharacterized membrane protein YcjF (UPF0283 family)
MINTIMVLISTALLTIAFILTATADSHYIFRWGASILFMILSALFVALVLADWLGLYVSRSTKREHDAKWRKNLSDL